jgi:hypothetical protein
MLDSIEEFLSKYTGIINLVNIVATLIIAFAALWLSVIGTNINSRMENAALYEKRKEIYDIAQQQIGMALFHPEEGKMEFFKLSKAKRESSFFYGVEVVERLNTVSNFVTKLYDLHSKYKNNIPENEFGAYLNEATVLAESLDKEIEPYFEISARKP